MMRTALGMGMEGLDASDIANKVENRDQRRQIGRSVMTHSCYYLQPQYQMR